MEQFQLDHATKVIRVDDPSNPLRFIGGLDISFSETNPRRACAYLTIVDAAKANEKKELPIVHKDYLFCQLELEYISGFLGFREVPFYLELLNRIRGKDFFPDVVLVDGFGVMHVREFGSASHLGVLADIPTIGVAKTMISIDGLTEREVRAQCKLLDLQVGDSLPLLGTTGEEKKEWGAALRSSADAVNPIYISIGHRISLETAIEVVKSVCRYRIPEPIRHSDIASRELLRVLR
jgi:deoxyinosine 3'endonuclease (endonuclease V)